MDDNLVGLNDTDVLNAGGDRYDKKAMRGYVFTLMGALMVCLGGACAWEVNHIAGGAIMFSGLGFMILNTMRYQRKRREFAQEFLRIYHEQNDSQEPAI